MNKSSPAELDIHKKEEALAEKRKLLKDEEDLLIQEKVILRKMTVKKQYDSFIAGQSRKTQDAVYLNMVLLQSAIRSYYLDIHRYKNFSGSKWANKYKQAAYTIKWLVRYRPIQIKHSVDHISQDIFDINIKFALVCGFAFLDEKMVELIMKNKQELDLLNKPKIEDEKEYSFFDKLMYDLRYRDLSGKKLVLAFEALELAYS